MTPAQDVLLVNPSQAYPSDKSVDASSSLRSTELNGFAYRALDTRSGSDSGSADRHGNSMRGWDLIVLRARHAISVWHSLCTR